MIREELVEKVAIRLQWSQEKTSDIIDTITEVIKAELKINNPVMIEEFGILETEIQPEYIMVDPESNDRYLMPPSVDVVLKPLTEDEMSDSAIHSGFGFIADQILYNEVNSSFASFEPSLLNKGVQFPGIPEIIVEELEELKELKELKEIEEIEKVAEVEENSADRSVIAHKEVIQSNSETLDVKDENNHIKHSPHQIHSQRQVKSHKRKLSVWVPIAGGIAIIMASLFFFKGEDKY